MRLKRSKGDKGFPIIRTGGRLPAPVLIMERERTVSAPAFLPGRLMYQKIMSQVE
jgi:hypothetical protein